MKVEMPTRRKTIFIDIDGTLFHHKDNLYHMIKEEPILLDGTLEKFLEWRAKEYYIVLTTARTEGCRKATEEQLYNAGIFYDQLVMGLPAGPRVLINDIKPNGMLTAEAVNLVRNKGIYEVEV
jgi:hypothetical protein